jgi:hypothetical protein
VLIVPLGILAVIKLGPPELLAECRKAAELAHDKPVSRGAAVVIVVIWAASIGLTGWLIGISRGECVDCGLPLCACRNACAS